MYKISTISIILTLWRIAVIIVVALGILSCFNLCSIQLTDNAITICNQSNLLHVQYSYSSMFSYFPSGIKFAINSVDDLVIYTWMFDILWYQFYDGWNLILLRKCLWAWPGLCRKKEKNLKNIWYNFPAIKLSTFDVTISSMSVLRCKVS